MTLTEQYHPDKWGFEDAYHLALAATVTAMQQ
jgi:hypothetical protein